MDEEVPLPTRIKAAMETAQYVHPKLAAVIDRFAAMLDAAIARSGNSNRSQGLIEVKPAAAEGSTRPTRSLSGGG
jgi:hypothetical protein